MYHQRYQGVSLATLPNQNTKLTGRSEIILHDLLCRLEKFTIRRVSNSEMIPGFADDILVEAPLLGFGLVYEANDVARSIRGKLHAHAVRSRSLIVLSRRFTPKQNDASRGDWDGDGGEHCQSLIS